MNTANLKKYGPEARRDFIEAVKDRAAYYGLTADEVMPLKVDGEAAIIGDKHFPASIAGKRRALEKRIEAEGFNHVMDAVAYTWFNRLVAIRYMELHDYLDHGYRVLSHPEGDANPEILAHAEHLDLPGLGNDTVVELKLAGNKDAELYRLLLIAQCNALSKAMPFLFERIDDESELLLPENLLKSDSLVRRLVNDVSEEDWHDIEVIGWLYQFYISEEKARIDKYSKKKPVKSRDIPGKTQLFTPSWIVKYLVHNSIGEQWLAASPASSLREEMEFYIEPVDQTKEVRASLAATKPGSLRLEEITLIDPACGSGHILVEAYELLKAMYLERGYRLRDIPKLILEKNLLGLDIDQRAAQLAGFSLIMVGRADDRGLFERGVNLRVMALVDSQHFDAERISQGMNIAEFGVTLADLRELKVAFEHATTFGSLIQIDDSLARKLPALRKVSHAEGNLLTWDVLGVMRNLVRQTELLSAQYDAVIMNPPYMGSGGMNSLLKTFVKDNFPSSKPDLFACFMERVVQLMKHGGYSAMVTMQSWMFLPNFEKLREKLFRETRFVSLAHLGPRAFDSIGGDIVSTTAFSLQKVLQAQGARGTFLRLVEGRSEAEKVQMLVDALSNERGGIKHVTSISELPDIPGKPIAYWLGPKFNDVFDSSDLIGEVFPVRTGLQTGDNDRFVRLWTEVDSSSASLKGGTSLDGRNSSLKWFPLIAGGSYRRWFGNNEKLVDWQDDGLRIKEDKKRKLDSGKITANNSKCWNEELYFEPCVTWTKIKSQGFGVRVCHEGAVFDIAGSSVFPDPDKLLLTAAFLNSKIAAACLEAINPTVNSQPGDIARFPWHREPLERIADRVRPIASAALSIATKDWNAYERSWDFESLPMVDAEPRAGITLAASYGCWISQNIETIAEMKRLEEASNGLLIDAYGLQAELASNVPVEQITLTVNPSHRYSDTTKKKWTEGERWNRFRMDSMQELVSYAVGCMMGRYNLDSPGLYYANGGNRFFDGSAYRRFPADDDGIVPLTDAEWFEDDATHRLEEFLSVAWDKEHLEENLTFLSSSLVPKKGENSRETLRRYLSQSFFKDHLKTYKNRPVYWLFTSGKSKALECLVYLHRYHEGTLSRMRTEYVIPLQGKVASRINQLSDDIVAATSTSHRKQLQKRHDVLVKQREELRVFDEKLRHYADQRIHIDLDDGVKVNYGKFGDLLANVKDITGKKPT